MTGLLQCLIRQGDQALTLIVLEAHLYCLDLLSAVSWFRVARPHWRANLDIEERFSEHLARGVFVEWHNAEIYAIYSVDWYELQRFHCIALLKRLAVELSLTGAVPA